MFETPEKSTYFHPVLTAETLLSDPYFPHLLQKIKAYSGLKSLHYQMLYEQLNADFAAFVQATPYRAKGKPGTLLSYSLERAANVLEQYNKAERENIDIRFAYALYTAALFQDIGVIMGQQKISICDADGRVLEDWLPHGKSMPEGGYYRLWFLGDQWFSIRKYSTPLLARQLMTPSGFNWIAEDLPTYKMWLEALVGEGDEDENKLLKFLTMDIPAEGGGGKWLPSAILRPQHPKATGDGDAFLDWLIEGIEGGGITTNQSDSMVFILPSGELFLVSPMIFQAFVDQYSGSLKWQDVCEQFGHLGLTDNFQDRKVNFDAFHIRNQQEKMGAGFADKVFAWGASHFSAQKTSALSQKVRGDQMVREGIVLQSLLFRNQALAKGGQWEAVRRQADVSKQQGEQGKEERSLEKLMQQSSSQSSSFDRQS